MIKPILNFYGSSIGKKWIVALTGLVLIGYVFGHLAGNLQIFISPNQLNTYAAFLHSLGPILWVVRLFLIAAFVLHIFTTIRLAIENRKARGAGYETKRHIKSSLASRTMVLSGLIVLCFVIYHLLHFTVRNVPPEFAQYVDEKGRHDTFRMVVEGFHNPFATAFYVLGVGLLCLHLSHGFGSVLQTFGLTNKSLLKALSYATRALAALIFAGYIIIPVSVLAGFGSKYVDEARKNPARMQLEHTH
jgi:succinate dehydrogenase / fumarate reductase cytochrome b subunit